MPAQTTHEAMTRVIFDKSYSEYHRYRDEGWEMGAIHHLRLRHGPIGDMREAWRQKDIVIIPVGLLHDLADYSPLTAIDYLRGKYDES